jgi:DNA polymerase III subunit gamma/tau
VESPLALYRRYRPETFAEVIGQDHVTEPLRAALAGNRVNHAYLFSGPRGCGKTTSARILARALNCEKAPVADPCGECESCVELGRGGSGSIDVIEIDAASHGGVDDARDLREKAFFAPVKSRYKVYIIDEAHMVSTQGFNALLKLVEEPPPHLRFIFATTEPDKVIPTIRSRTHHYPFRLIPPRLLTSYLSELCEKESVAIEPAALPLVVRAGGGSARDTLSVLDQLMGGAGPDGITYDLAAGLLGYTPDTLLDEVVDAFAAGDGSAVFGVVDKVIETGQDPRRFTEDLLRRLRDLSDRHRRGRRRAVGRAGRALRPGRAQPGGRPGGDRPDRDAGRDSSAPAARAHLRARAAAGCRPLDRRRDGTPRPARAPDDHHRWRPFARPDGAGRARVGEAGAPRGRAHRDRARTPGAERAGDRGAAGRRRGRTRPVT